MTTRDHGVDPQGDPERDLDPDGVHHRDELPRLTLAEPKTAGPLPAPAPGPGPGPEAQQEHSPSEVETSTQSTVPTVLFADDQLAGLRSRWDAVQAGFVDDPRNCVQRADGLVSDVVGQLTSSFTEARSHLEQNWARGEEASTEDLRVALTRYRDFFERLLAV